MDKKNETKIQKEEIDRDDIFSSKKPLSEDFVADIEENGLYTGDDDDDWSHVK